MKIHSVISQPEIRFADIDVMGHVNNAIYLNYFEQARMYWFAALVGQEWDWHTNGILLARNEINYRIPVRLHDKLEIETWCNKIGNKSIELMYVVFVQNAGTRTIMADGLSVMVCFDYHQQKTIAVPDKWREALNTDANNK
jgi:acyl-CoA thioester hydrolase